ncbi:hypothetical protein ACFYYL_10585 [Actinomadura geliboluensis]|uniref:hypothetical protein n=1 Tax=Actinomadura geliboluensis TaxID=882440 RepID=UPI00368BD752
MATGEVTYDSIMEDLRVRIPALASQLDEEVLRGKAVAAADLSNEERAYRVDSVRAAEPQGAGKLKLIEDSDVAVIPYSEDERLHLLCTALLKLAETMYESRRELMDLIETSTIESYTLRFTEPDGSGEERFDLVEEVSSAKVALQVTRNELSDWISRMDGDGVY